MLFLSKCILYVCIASQFLYDLKGIHLRRLGFGLGRTRVVGAGGEQDCSGLECLLLGFGMRRPGTHIPRTYRVHPDQKQLFGLRQGLEAAGVVGGGWAPAPGNVQSA